MNEGPEAPEDGWHESAVRIAAHCTRTFRGSAPLLSPQDKFDAALDAIVEYVADFGWPDGDLKPVYRAGGTGIARASRASYKDLRFWSHWVEPPGPADAIGEAITDKIAIREVMWLLTEAEWDAVWATAEVMKWGGSADEAAALIGIGRTALSQRLLSARRKCWKAWVAPGETPWATIYKRTYDGRASRFQHWVDRQKQRTDRRAELADAVVNGEAKVATIKALSELTNGNITIQVIRQWVKDGDLPVRGMVFQTQAYSVDEFVRLAIAKGKLGTDPRQEKAA